jgi:hypothetical protein
MRKTIQEYSNKQLELQEKFMRALALQGVNLKVKYSILSAQEILAEVKRERNLFCKA